MRKILSVSVFGSIFVAGIAFSAPSEARVNCDQMADIAHEVMTDRQNGRSMRDTMNDIREQYDSGFTNELAEAIVRDAYNNTRYDDSERQQRAVEEFENQVYGECVQYF